MKLRVLHTSDWHLGHALHDIGRVHEHDCFLSWLLDTLERESVDAIVIAGDIFDTANPSAGAQRQWYRFLARARTRMPSLDIVAIAGNHDSASRLEAPRALLDELDIHVVGSIPRAKNGAIDLDRVLVPLRDAKGDVAAWCAAVPFLRPADLPRLSDAEDPLIEGVRAVYTEVLDGAEARSTGRQARIALGHCYMKSATLSELSERKILGGNEHALPADLFDDRVTYAALGHLHLGQKVAGTRHVRYSGSPIPLSMDEAPYEHHVCLATFEDGELADVAAVPIPRAVGMLRIPEQGPKPRDEVLSLLAALPADASPQLPPYLEVRMLMDRPDSAMRRMVADAVKGKHARLVKLTVQYTGSGKSLAEQVPDRHLEDLTVEDVFMQLYRSKHDSEPSEALLSCFREIVDSVHAGEPVEQEEAS